MLPKLRSYIETAKALHPLLSDFSSDLRRSIRLAGLRYETHHTKDSLVEQLLDLTIALEALFSPSDQTELSFRISQGVALVLGKSAAERKNIFEFAKKMYSERSGFVHGGKDPVETNTITVGDIQHLGDLVRRAILSFGTMFARGERSRANLHKEILLAAFDSVRADELRMRSDIEIFSVERSRSAGSQ